MVKKHDCNDKNVMDEVEITSKTEIRARVWYCDTCGSVTARTILNTRVLGQSEFAEDGQ